MLSNSTTDARDRIGTGPWYNADGDLIAQDVDSLFTSPPATALILDEQGNAWDGGNSTRHDVLTGSDRTGRRFTGLMGLTSGHPNPNGSLFTFPDNSWTYTNQTFDFSCADWSSNGGAMPTVDYAVVGHADWSTVAMPGTGSDQWLTSHMTACDAMSMQLDQGDIRLYCFAAN